MTGHRQPPAPGGEEALLRAFVDLLEREERALAQGDAEAVAALAADKARHLGRLAALDPAPAADPALRALRERARLANERNGRLIALRLSRVSERLEALAGGEAPGSAYGADGLARFAPARALTAPR